MTNQADPWPHCAGFYLLRHGETDWNREGLCVGQTDRPLTELGRRQAVAAREAVKVIAPARVVHSTLSRATQTAELVSCGLQCDLVPDEDLREVCLGKKEGASEHDPEDDFISTWMAGAEIEGAEPFDIFQARVACALARGVAQIGPHLFVGHWGTFAAVSRLTGNPVFDPDHCVLYRVTRNKLNWLVERA